MRQSNHRRDFSREVPLSQLGRRLSEAEESGVISQELGLLQARQRQHSATAMIQRDASHVAYVHPPLRAHVPLPSTSRPAQRRPEASA